MIASTIATSATISPCGTYRYTLYRRIPQTVRHVKPCLFIMLNPSKANATEDDPTIRRCVGFANSWLCTDLTVVNLFALRATDPDELAKHADPVGPDNDQHIQEQVEKHYRIGIIIAAWGAFPFAEFRARQVAPMLPIITRALGTTKVGWPRHPLYLRSDTEPTMWRMP